MKQRIKIFTQIAMILLIYVSQSVYAQINRNGTLRYQDENWKLWTIEANTGILSFYGDLSSYDDNYLDKIKYERGPGLGLYLTKHFNSLLAISGQLLIGQLNGSNHNSSFTSDLFEYDLNVKINILNLFYPDNKGNFGILAEAGIGQFWFSSIKSYYAEGSNFITKHNSRVPEFIYFIGAGTFLRANSNVGISMDISLRQFQNDWLDVTVKNNDYDYYTYLSLGIVYYLDNPLQKEPIKNRARIAHNNAKLKHL
jgi:hypothetical protein